MSLTGCGYRLEDGSTRRRVMGRVPPIDTVPLISSPFTVNSPTTMRLVLWKRNTSPATVPLIGPATGPEGLMPLLLEGTPGPLFPLASSPARTRQDDPRLVLRGSHANSPSRPPSPGSGRSSPSARSRSRAPRLQRWPTRPLSWLSPYAAVNQGDG